MVAPLPAPEHGGAGTGVLAGALCRGIAGGTAVQVSMLQGPGGGGAAVGVGV